MWRGESNSPESGGMGGWGTLGEALGLPELALGGPPGVERGREAARRGAEAGPNAPPSPALLSQRVSLGPRRRARAL